MPPPPPPPAPPEEAEPPQVETVALPEAVASILPPAPAPEEEAEPEPDPRLVEALMGAIEQVMQSRAEVLAQTASQLAELAVMIARRVIARELSIGAEVVHSLVAEGLDALGNHDRVLVRLGGGFAELREDVQSRLLRNGASCEVRVDMSLAKWGCVVETELGRVDESVESRLATLLQALKPDSNPPT